jgi:hypothetical protein
MNAHYRLGANYALNLFKVAKIFGEAEPDYDVDTIPFEHRQQLHNGYHLAKSDEEPTGYGKAIGVGALGGGAAGALLGGGAAGAFLGGAHSMGGMLLGGALGALGGGAVGGLAAHHDINNIEESKNVAGMPDQERVKHLVRRIQSQRVMSQIAELAQAERRHQEMLNAMDGRPHRRW